MGRYEDLVEQLRESDADLAEQFEEFAGSNLRKKAELVPQLEAKVSELEGKVQTLEQMPLKSKAFEEYGVKLEELRPAERRLVEDYDGELDPEKIGAFVAEFDLPVSKNEDEGGEGETPPAAEVVAHATKGPKNTGGGSLKITPQQVNDWPADKILRFREKHPEAFEDIKRGESVSGIAFS